MNHERASSWSSDRSVDLYRIDEWGEGYFGVSPEGDLLVRPLGEAAEAISLPEVVTGLDERGLSGDI